MGDKRKGVFFGIVVKSDILAIQSLTIAEKFVFSYVDSYSQACMDSNERIADRLGISSPTVTRALKSLQKAGFLAIEYVKGNHAKRKIHAIYNKPNKCRTLTNKNRGTSGSFPQSFAQVNQNDERVNQNDSKVNQNDEPRNRGEVNQNDYHRIIRINKNKEGIEQLTSYEPQSAGLAGDGPASRFIDAERFKDKIDFEREFYERNTFHLGAFS